MRRRIGITLALVAVLVAAVAVPSGSAATKKSHKIDASIVARALEGNLDTGTIKGKLGSGAVVYTVSSNPDGTQHLAVKAFLPKGSLKGFADVSFTINPDNTANFTGSGKITGGTALYKGAKGSYTTNGTIDQNGIVRGTITGSAKY